MIELRNRRARAVRASTENLTRLPKRELQLLRADAGDIDHGRPLTRGDCELIERPCPFVGCRHHLYLDVARNGNIKLNFPELQPEQLSESCSLDVADQGGESLEFVAELMNITREMVRQMQNNAGRIIAKRHRGLEKYLEEES